MATVFRSPLFAPASAKLRYVPDTPVNLLLTTLAVVAAAPFHSPEFPTPQPAPRVQVALPPNLLTSTLYVAGPSPFVPDASPIFRPTPRFMGYNPPNVLVGGIPAPVAPPFSPPDNPGVRPPPRYITDIPPNLLTGQLISTCTEQANATDTCDATIFPRQLNRLNPDVRASQRTRHYEQRLARSSLVEVPGKACSTAPCTTTLETNTASGAQSMQPIMMSVVATVTGWVITGNGSGGALPPITMTIASYQTISVAQNLAAIFMTVPVITPGGD